MNKPCVWIIEVNSLMFAGPEDAWWLLLTAYKTRAEARSECVERRRPNKPLGTLGSRYRVAKYVNEGEV